MMNIPHTPVAMTPKQRNFFWACIGFLFAVFAVLMFFILRENNLAGPWNEGGFAMPKRAERVMSAEERLRAIATETKTLTGTIDQVTTLKESKTKFLRVRAFVIDREKISEVQTNEPSVSLPTTEDFFDVVVNEETNVKGDGGMDAIRSGDFVTMTTAENIYDAKRLTAVSIEKFSGVSTGTRNKK